MTNIIYVNKINNHHILTYRDFKSECFIGKNGLTKEKEEGDLKTPVGKFKLGIAFGIHPKEKIKIDPSFIYKEINKNLYWVDDINSVYYNQLVDITKVNKDWISAESLIENKIPYEYAIEIKTNPSNIKGKGSAIFIHCKNKNYTAGCISLPKDKMIELLSIINPNTEIIIENK